MVGALAALIFVLNAHSAPRGGADTNSVRALSGEEAAEMWAEFSRSGIAGDYCMEFSIAHRPRRGEETQVDLTGLTPGVYLLNVSTTASNMTRKVVVD